MSSQSDDAGKMLRDAGIRVTRQRLSVIATLARANDHPTAEDVYKRVAANDGNASFATVYRTLATLERCGLVQRIVVDDGPVRFEMAAREDHDHLVDVGTGKVIEIISHELSALRQKLAGQRGYEIISQQSVLRFRKIRG